MAGEVVDVAGFPVRRYSASELVGELEFRRDRGASTCLFFANTNLVVQCQGLKDRMSDARVIIVNDGIGLSAGAFISSGARFEQNLNGTDFIPLLCSSTGKPYKIFLIGGTPQSIDRAAHHFTSSLQQNVVGICDGYEQMRTRTDLVQEINRSGADMVLVALGNPRQEAWILDHAAELEGKLLVGVGALFDFLSGAAQRAPSYVRKLKLEWLYRLYREPRRLFKRYTVDVLRFFLLCLKYRKA